MDQGSAFRSFLRIYVNLLQLLHITEALQSQKLDLEVHIPNMRFMQSQYAILWKALTKFDISDFKNEYDNATILLDLRDTRVPRMRKKRHLGWKNC